MKLSPNSLVSDAIPRLKKISLFLTISVLRIIG
nr:MAG TPA: hypothetical protein [Caudoviricetes sp.]